MIRSPLPMVLFAIFALTGCPLVSDHPLSDPSEARIDRGLVGSWDARDPDSGEPTRLTFLPFDDRELVGFGPRDENGGIDALRAFTTAIDGEFFLNVRELERDSSGWYILRYRIDGRRLVMTLVDDNLFENETFAGPAELREFLRKHLADPRLYAPKAGEPGQDMVWERASR